MARREEAPAAPAGASEVLVLRAQVAAMNADLQRESEVHRDSITRLVRQYPLQNVSLAICGHRDAQAIQERWFAHGAWSLLKEFFWERKRAAVDCS